MIPAQLLALADQHQAAHHTGGTRTPTESGPSLLAMAAMQ